MRPTRIECMKLRGAGALTGYLAAALNSLWMSFCDSDGERPVTTRLATSRDLAIWGVQKPHSEAVSCWRKETVSEWGLVK
eukprot:12798051-Heterocapsa_arctica.AAC.1